MTLLTSLIDNKLVIASHNDGKIQEIRDLFKSEKISILTSNDFLLKDLPTKEITNPHNGIKIITNMLNLGLIINIDISVKITIRGSLTINSKIDKNELSNS